MEKCLGWRAVLVEGHPINAKTCSENRGHCEHSALCEEVDGTTEVVDGGGSAGDPSLLSGAIINKWQPRWCGRHVTFVSTTSFIVVVVT